jgi:glycosyltransferase involved in cell wall biosynthesis
VIYDDGSTDNTVEKILQYNDPRIKLIQNDINQGIGIARQQAFKHSSGN